MLRMISHHVDWTNLQGQDQICVVLWYARPTAQHFTLHTQLNVRLMMDVTRVLVVVDHTS
jgi:hypothetical protein